MGVAMATAGAILDDALIYLHDDGTIWTRTELLDYLNQGYRNLLLQTKAARNLVAFDVPPRPAWSISQPWERQHVSILGSVHEWSWADAANGSRSSYEWEAEAELGITPTASESTYTYPWERIESTDNVREEPERYAYPGDHLRTYRLSFDGQRLPPLSIQELDGYSPRWEMEDGEPTWYHAGLRRKKEFSVYPIASAYVENIIITDGLGTISTASGGRSYSFTQEIVLEGFAFTANGDITSTALAGPGRKITRDTTVSADYQAMFLWEKQHVEGNTPTNVTTYALMYPWEAVFVDQSYTTLAGLGLPESLIGGRDYYVSTQQQPGMPPYGTIGYWKSSEDALLLDYALSAPTMAETDSPSLLPLACAKYLRWYVLAKAFSREGEGQHPVLANHFLQRYQLAVRFMRRLANFAAVAQTHQLQGATITPGRRPKPRLPAEYPRVW